MKKIIMLVMALCVFTANAETNGLSLFRDKILPILDTKCVECHNSKDKKKGGLELDNADGLKRGGSSGRIITPHSPEKSSIVSAISGKNKDLKMPPDDKERLTDTEVEYFKSWILLGAPDDRQIKKIDFSKHWSFTPLVRPTLPKNNEQNPIDRIAIGKMMERGILPAGEADSRDLVRRLYFDMTGLPPAYEIVKSFENDKTKQAWEKLVRDVLKSPHYGERWARYWMDLARYSDYRGGNNNRISDKYVYAWTYRDYLIESFNSNKPYNQFLIEQLAADQLSTNFNSSLAAMGFLAVGKSDNDNNNRIDEKINTISRTFIGMSVGCARCHYHKFDPISQEDYYGWHGILKSLSEPSELPIIKSTESHPEYAKYLANKAKLEKELDTFEKTEYAKWSAYFLKHAPEYFRGAFYNEYLSREIRRDYLRTNRIDGVQMSQRVSQNWIRETQLKSSDFWTPYQKLTAVTNGQYSEVLSSLQTNKTANQSIVAALSRLKITNSVGVLLYYEGLFRKAAVMSTNKPSVLSEGIEPIYLAQNILLKDSSPTRIGTVKDFQNFLPNQQQNTYQNGIRVITEKIYQHEWDSPATPPRAQTLADSGSSNSRLLIKGNAGKLGDEVPRRLLQFFDEKIYTNKQARLDFAKDMVNLPMTARVMVNRIWASHFNNGFVMTPDDIGANAEQPELVDVLNWLSCELVSSGWDVKHIHELILTSRLYKQSVVNSPKYSIKDPGNRLFWKQNIGRLEFEYIRDTILYSGGVLSTNIGGQPKQISEPYRSLYCVIDRNRISETWNVFDFANPNMTTGKRFETIIPQQALYLMNGDIAERSAETLLKSLSTVIDEESKIDEVYKKLFQRHPSKLEVKIGKSYIESGNSWVSYIHGLLMSNELVYIN